MKVAIVVHSSCGNTYLVGREYKKALEVLELKVDIFKVEDNRSKEFSNYFMNAEDLKGEFEQIKVINSGKELIEYDVIFMGSPTYYGNVSGQMKMFLDNFADIWIDAPFRGKYFGSFTTCSSVYGGGEFALQAMNTFAQHMGMVILSVPCNIGCNQPAYGIIHVSGPQSNIKLSDDVKLGILSYLNNLKIFK